MKIHQKLAKIAKIYEKSSKIIKNHQKSSILTISGAPSVFRPEGPKIAKKRRFLTIFGSKMIGKAMEPCFLRTIFKNRNILKSP